MQSQPQYLHQIDIRNAQELPVKDQQRKCTDVCCLIIGILFGLIIFILACVRYSSANLEKANYPADSNGKVCMLDTQTQVNNYPFLYFNDLSKPSTDRFCVKDCPQKGVPAQCYNNCTIDYYPNYPSSTRLGAFCLPQDQNLREQLLYDAKITHRFNNLKSLDYLLMGVGISFGISILWVILVQLLPKIIYWIAIVLALFLLFVGMLVFFIGSGNTLVDGQGWAIIIGIICLVLFVTLILYSYFHRKQIYITGCFLQIATTYLKKDYLTLIWIPIFVGLSFLFGLLLAFEYLAFSSSGTPIFDTKYVYYQNKSNWFANFVLVIQAFWGFSFFRDMFNYIFSGLTCQWYFQKQVHWYTPLKKLFTKNIGSIASGSFLTCLFFIPSLIISVLFPQTDCCFCNFFDMARSDAYTWIYLSGNSYCPSSRQTQYLCRRSSICRENQSVIDVYSFVARVVLAFISMLIVYWIARDNLVQSRVPPYLLLGIFCICLFITCYCSDLHPIIAQALLVCFLAEYELDEGWTYKQMHYCPKELRDLITDIDSKTQYGFPHP